MYQKDREASMVRTFTTSHSRLCSCWHRVSTRFMLPADGCHPQNHQVRAYTTTNSTQARPPPGDQRPHGGDHIDRSSRTPPSARQATTHGVIVDMSLICTPPTSASLTSPCSSSDPRGQRGRDRRRRPTCTTYAGTRRGRRGCTPPSAERTACRVSARSSSRLPCPTDDTSHLSSAAPSLLHCAATRRRARLGDVGGQ